MISQYQKMVLFYALVHKLMSYNSRVGYAVLRMNLELPVRLMPQAIELDRVHYINVSQATEGWRYIASGQFNCVFKKGAKVLKIPQGSSNFFHPDAPLRARKLWNKINGDLGPAELFAIEEQVYGWTAPYIGSTLDDFDEAKTMVFLLNLYIDHGCTMWDPHPKNITQDYRAIDMGGIIDFQDQEWLDEGIQKALKSGLYKNVLSPRKDYGRSVSNLVSVILELAQNYPGLDLKSLKNEDRQLEFAYNMPALLGILGDFNEMLKDLYRSVSHFLRMITVGEGHKRRLMRYQPEMPVNQYVELFFNYRTIVALWYDLKLYINSPNKYLTILLKDKVPRKLEKLNASIYRSGLFYPEYKAMVKECAHTYNKILASHS